MTLGMRVVASAGSAWGVLRLTRRRAGLLTHAARRPRLESGVGPGRAETWS